MKNDTHNLPPRDKREILPDIVVDEKLAKLNNTRLADRARPRRRINYVKKILNDDFLMGME